MKFWNMKTFFVVTGAGRGFGRTCAMKFAENVAPGSMGLLLARNDEGLSQTKKMILERSTQQPIKISTLAHDLTKPDGIILGEKITKFLNEHGAKASDFDHAMIVHGTMMLGSMTRHTLGILNVEELQRYFSINTFAPVVLNSHFMAQFKDSKKMRTVLNTTSDGALRPYRSLSFFCAASTAREAFMCVTAKEEPSILVLNYNPGPLDIHMDVIRTSKEEDLHEYVKTITDQGRVISCEQSVEKLVKLLANREFLSGEHVEYNELK